MDKEIIISFFIIPIFLVYSGIPTNLLYVEPTYVFLVLRPFLMGSVPLFSLSGLVYSLTRVLLLTNGI